MLLTVCNSSNHEISAYQAVLDIVSSQGVYCEVYHQDHCLESDFLSVAIDNHEGFQYLLQRKTRKIKLDSVQAIWYIKPSIPRRIFDELDFRYANFINKQFYTVRESLRYVFKDKIWLNHPVEEQIAESKIWQLKIAQSVGFKIPHTIISSNPESIRTFQKRVGRIITKPLAPTIIMDYVIYTKELTADELGDDEAILLSPAIYQELVSKKYELRITVVGNDIYSAKINSQDDIQTAIDWRSKPLLNDYEVTIEPTEISNSLKKKIIEFMRLMGLNFGCLDLIVTEENEIIFLEVNPNGQWYFVQLKTGMQIANSIARSFLQRIGA